MESCAQHHERGLNELTVLAARAHAADQPSQRVDVALSFADCILTGGGHDAVIPALSGEETQNQSNWF
jgi:hypothetical protein